MLPAEICCSAEWCICGEYEYHGFGGGFVGYEKPDLYDTLRKIDAEEIVTAGHHSSRELAHSIRDHETRQTWFILQEILRNLGQCGRQCHRFQTAASFGEIVSNALQAFRQYDLRQTIAVRKHIISDLCQCRRQDDHNTALSKYNRPKYSKIFYGSAPCVWKCAPQSICMN